MKDRRVSPQEKKIRDYIYQMTNCYGYNDKNSRTSIRKNKAMSLRAYRRKVQSELRGDLDDFDLVEHQVACVTRGNWKKFPDECLLKSFEHKWANNSRTCHIKQDKRTLQNEALKRLNKIKTREYWY